MKRMFCCLSAACMAVALLAEEFKPARVDFTSNPEGARVAVDGKVRGVTPLVLFDLSAGEHRVNYSLPEYASADEFIRVESAVHLTRHVELEPLKGLLLVTTEPVGCEVSLDGVSFGLTPRLVTTLDSTRNYRLLLKKPGYQSRLVDVRFEGRSPIVLREVLLLDAGCVEISSEPSGAKVTVNGIPRGKTPLVVNDIPKGDVEVVVSLDGYRSVTRRLSLNAGDELRLPVSLEALPGVLRIATVPEGARVYVNDEYRGKGPLELEALKAGIYKVRAEADGYSDVTRTAMVKGGVETSLDLRLSNVLGRVEVKTRPAGAKLVLDGRLVGSTVAIAGSETSELYTINSVKEGPHTLAVRMDGYGEVVKKIVVSPAKPVMLNVALKRLFVPNVRIKTETGVYDGVLNSSRSSELLELEVKPGVIRSFVRSSVLSVEVIAP